MTRPTKPYTDMSFGMGKEGFPAISMTQLAAKTYCKWLSAKTGRYYRLPTEAEWEYACRAGSKTAYSFGDDPAKLGEYAWHADNSDDAYHKVGTKKPNPWGLYDMHGNVCEWTLDQFTSNFYQKCAGKTVKGPLALPTKLYPQVVRGGSWDDDEQAKLRSAARAARITTGSSRIRKFRRASGTSPMPSSWAFGWCGRCASPPRKKNKNSGTPDPTSTCQNKRPES